MSMEIRELYRVKGEEYEKLYDTILDAFSHYSKLLMAYPDWDDRQAAIKMVVSYYLAYDFRFGHAYSLDGELNEGLVIVHSDEMSYSEDKIREARCVNEKFMAAASELTEEQVRFWWDFFEEFDRQERSLNIPCPHIYVDYLGVRQKYQNEGRGSRLLEFLKAKADELGLPVMLFTNGEEDISFYLNRGFRIIGMTRSEKFLFENTYMLYEPEHRKTLQEKKFENSSESRNINPGAQVGSSGHTEHGSPCQGAGRSEKRRP